MLNHFKKTETWENIAIILSIVSLWPTIYLSKVKKVDSEMIWVKPYKILLAAILFVLLINQLMRQNTIFELIPCFEQFLSPLILKLLELNQQ